MLPLKKLLSQNGFTSSESYDHAIECFLQSESKDDIPCLHIDGTSGRRRSAFAHALANALEVDHLLYYEFGRDKKVPQIIRIQEGEEVVEELPVEALDKILTDACALSEAESVVLILDQLHLTQFLNHIRLYEFLKSNIWRYNDVQYQANYLNLKIFMISDEELYHSLQAASFKVWVSDVKESVVCVSAQDMGIEDTDIAIFATLQSLFGYLKLMPTVEEYHHVLKDIDLRIYNEEQLKISLFGWVEGIDRQQLNHLDCQPYMKKVLSAILETRQINEEIEISGINPTN